MSKRDLNLTELDAYVDRNLNIHLVPTSEDEFDSSAAILTPDEAVELAEWLSEVTS